MEKSLIIWYLSAPGQGSYPAPHFLTKSLAVPNLAGNYLFQRKYHTYFKTELHFLKVNALIAHQTFSCFGHTVPNIRHLREPVKAVLPHHSAP